jgi:hypothetical protein
MVTQALGESWHSLIRATHRLSWGKSKPTTTAPTWDSIGAADIKRYACSRAVVNVNQTLIYSKAGLIHTVSNLIKSIASEYVRCRFTSIAYLLKICYGILSSLLVCHRSIRRRINQDIYCVRSWYSRIHVILFAVPICIKKLGCKVNGGKLTNDSQRLFPRRLAKEELSE